MTHIRHVLGIPLADGLIKSICPMKHALHGGAAAHVPVANVHVKFLGTGRDLVIMRLLVHGFPEEQRTIRDPTDVPLGHFVAGHGVVVEFGQAFQNEGLEGPVRNEGGGRVGGLLGCSDLVVMAMAGS